MEAPLVITHNDVIADLCSPAGRSLPSSIACGVIPIIAPGEQIRFVSADASRRDRGHVWHRCQQPCEAPHCPYCDGGLAFCVRCRRGEGELANVCPASPLLLALTSPAMGAGKSEVARYLVERHGFTLLKFAGTLKVMMRALLNDLAIDDRTAERMIEGDLKEQPIDGLDVTPRRLMQTLGTEWGRDAVRADLWTHIMRLKVEAYRHIGGGGVGRDIVIDDLRFPNELDLVTDLGGIPVRVTRPGVADATGHVSEGALADCPMEPLANDGTIAELHQRVDHLVACARKSLIG